MKANLNGLLSNFVAVVLSVMLLGGMIYFIL